MEEQKKCELEASEAKKQALQNGISMGVDEKSGLVVIALNLNGQSYSMPMSLNEAATLHHNLANCISHLYFILNQAELKAKKEEQDRAQAEAAAKEKEAVSE